MRDDFRQLFRINGQPSRKLYWSAGFVWLGLFFLTWVELRPEGIPSPVAVLTRLLAMSGSSLLWSNLKASLEVAFLGVVFSSVLGLLWSYASLIPLFELPNRWIQYFRYLPVSGFTLGLMYLFTIGTPLKVAMLTLGMDFFLTTDMTHVVKSVPRTHVELARVLGYSEWQVFKTVYLEGTAPMLVEAVKRNAAIAFVMLAVVELSNRNEGGLGALMDGFRMTGQLDGMWACLVVIGMLALVTDGLTRFVISYVWPYTGKSGRA